MKTWIALFRGINMVGKHLLPMKELVVQLAGAGSLVYECILKLRII
jgi:uncharacterized protein (DUF1697 family)